MQNLVEKFTRLRGHFLLLGLLLILLNIRSFPHSVWYDGDTIYAFQIFYAFYNNLFYHHELLQWLPFGSYGIQADYWQLSFLTCAQYFTGLLGWTLHIQDVNFLFKLSVLFEQFMLLVGTYLLSLKLFKTRTSSIFVCLGILASSLWVPQINFNFRIYYLFPIILFHMLLFFDKKEPWLLWLAGITFVVAQIGVPVYFVMLHGMLLLIFFTALAVRTPAALFSISKSRPKDFFFLTVFITITAVYLYFAFHMFDGIATHSPGREAGSLAVSLDEFLTYGPDIGIKKFMGLVYAGLFAKDTSLYIGWLPLVFILYAFLRVRHPLFGIFSGITLLVVCLSLGRATPVAQTVYYAFPPIRFFRYIGNMGGLLRFFLIFLAGYGLDHYLTGRNSLRATGTYSGNQKILLGSACFVLLAALAVEFFLQGHKLISPPWREFFCFGLVLTTLWGFFLTKRQTATALGFTVILFFALDIISYKNLFQSTWRHQAPWIRAEAVRVYPFEFQEKRTLRRDLNSRMEAVGEIARKYNVRLLKEMHNFMLWDACICREVVSFHWSRGVTALLNARFPLFFNASNALTFLKDKSTPLFFQIFGCVEPKVRLVSDVVFSKDDRQALNLTLQIPDLYKTTVLTDVPRKIQKDWRHEKENLPLGKIEVRRYSFNRLDLEVAVDRSGGAWLYYADAYHPGWHAYADGKEIPVARANLAFKAVFLEKGSHEVSFVYWNGLKSLAGYGIALSGILFFTGMVFFGMVKIMSESRHRDAAI